MAELMLVNPRKRKTRRKAKKSVARKRPAARKRSVKRKTSRRRKNPVTRKTVQKQVMNAATSAMGALALDVMWGYMPVPMNIKTGPMRHIAKGLGALAVGFLAENLVKKSTANMMTEGALTVVMHSGMKEVAQQMMPNIPLGYYSPGMPSGVGEYVSGLGAYTTDGGASPYLSADTLSKPFAGPSEATMVRDTCASADGVSY